MVLNSKMKKLLSEKDLSIDLHSLEKTCYDILSKIKILKSCDCIIYDEFDEIDDRDLDRDFIFKVYGNLTGFEMWYNGIEFYFRSDKISIGSAVFNFFKWFKIVIKSKYPDKKFCVIIDEDSGSLFLRFHIYRQGEGLGIEENVEEDENPILYEIV